MYYIFKILAGSHYISQKNTKVLRKVKRGQTFKSNHDLEKSFGSNKFQKLGTCDGSCEEGELFKVLDISSSLSIKEDEPEQEPTQMVEVEVQEEDETVIDDNPVADSDGTDVGDDTDDEDDNEDIEEDSDDDEEVDEVEFTLPMKLDQQSERKFNVVDAEGIKVNDKLLSRKLANALIKSYKEA